MEEGLLKLIQLERGGGASQCIKVSCAPREPEPQKGGSGLGLGKGAQVQQYLDRDCNRIEEVRLSIIACIRSNFVLHL